MANILSDNCEIYQISIDNSGIPIKTLAGLYFEQWRHQITKICSFQALRGQWGQRKRLRGRLSRTDTVSQERIKRSLHLQYKPYESTFARIFLFLERRGVLSFAYIV